MDRQQTENKWTINKKKKEKKWTINGKKMDNKWKVNGQEMDKKWTRNKLKLYIWKIENCKIMIRINVKF